MAMDPKELDKLIRIGEGYTLEFKASPSHIAREICAFANAAGGRILVGVDDQGRKQGVKDPNRTLSVIQSTVRNIDPPLVLDMEALGNILIVSVPSGPNKPYSANGLFYIREAANSQRMTRDQIREFFFREGLIRFDEQPCRQFNMRKDFDSAKYQAFVKIANIPTGLRKEDVLKNLHVLSKEGMANAGVLLFGRRIPNFFLQASLSCALFQGKTKTKILDHRVLDGSIQENYGAATSYLQSHLNTEYVIKGGPREEVLELPEVALREALLNAIAHRDYRSTSNIQVNIYHDRVEVLNPGGLVSGLRLKDLGHVSRPRNLLLFSLMARMDLVEHIGSGIKRIREAVAAYGLQPPIIEADGDWFSITFRRKSTYEAIERSRRGGKVFTPSEKNGFEGINEGVNTLLDFIRMTPGLRTFQISKALDIPVRTLQRRLRKLKNQNKIEFRGSPRTGGYHAENWANGTVNGGVSGGINGGVNGGIKEAVNGGVSALFEFIRNSPGLKTFQISKGLGIPVRTLQRQLRGLMKQNRIEFRGSKKTGGYHVKE